MSPAQHVRTFMRLHSIVACKIKVSEPYNVSAHASFNRMRRITDRIAGKDSADALFYNFDLARLNQVLTRLRG